MNNIFDTIAKSLPKTEVPRVQQAPKEAPVSNAKLSNKDVVVAWQKNPTPALTSEVLKRLQPTMDSAISTFAGGQRNLEIKAAKLTLDALKSYNPDIGVEPSTYVFNNLRRLNRFGARRSNIIRQSEADALDNKRIRAAIATFQEDKDREPSMQELADLTGLSRKKLDRLMNGTAVVNESSTLTDKRKDTIAKNGLDDNDYFEYVYASVGPVDQRIMDWISGKHGNPALSNNEIARRLKISPAAVSQRKSKLQTMLSEIRELV